MKETISVVVSCWNALDLTKICLDRLLRLTEGPLEVVAVDNGSTDGTSAWLKALARRDGRLRLLRNAVNRGYPAAMNQGLEKASGHYVVLGSADAAVTKGWDAAMRQALAAEPRAAGVSPCSNAPRSPRPRAWSAPPHYRNLAELDTAAAAGALTPGPAFVAASGFVPGFWFMTTREELARAGGLDERFSPGGFEDWDLQWRLRRAGRLVGFAERAFVHHEWFGCSRRNGQRESRQYSDRRRLILTQKHPETADVGMEVRSYFDR